MLLELKGLLIPTALPTPLVVSCLISVVDVIVPAVMLAGVPVNAYDTVLVVHAVTDTIP